MKKKLYVLVIVLVIISLPLYLWYLQAVKPVNPLNRDFETFTIEKGENVRTISQRLESEKLVRSGLVFFLVSRFTDLGKSIQAGDFLLSPSMNLNEIAEELKHGTTDIRLTIPEGWRKEEIATKVAVTFQIPESEFLKTSEEGYLFPDTYSMPKEIIAQEIVQIMKDNFNKKMGTIDLGALDKFGLSLNDLVIIASLVEREAKLHEDRPLIASVILNRLKIGMKLDIDATVQYILGYQPNEKSWWKKDLTLEDLGTDSSYNTYINAGLPPAPIANPGYLSLKAVLEAPENNYLYYVADSNGKSHFAESFEEHASNISKYLSK
ncbi:hypothetical protein A3E42_04300 [Candidatus Gottesmanbacteria bacterium RIFCSPHIGHO2_12_FULL_40_13]|nr:MAG: hypothetical protein A3E42_04300 [Candidatus Gottesmanbacteria bacterium RIFCSPHIGHO2_12_FULL_40_13]